MAIVTNISSGNKEAEPIDLNFQVSVGSGGGESKGEEQHQTPMENLQTERNEIEKTGDIVESKDQGSEGEEEKEEKEEEGKLDFSFPCAQLTKKRAAQSPLMKEIGKKDCMGQMSESSFSDDLNRLFPLNTANEISFLSIKLKTSTPRAALSRKTGTNSRFLPYRNKGRA